MYGNSNLGSNDIADALRYGNGATWQRRNFQNRSGAGALILNFHYYRTSGDVSSRNVAPSCIIGQIRQQILRIPAHPHSGHLDLDFQPNMEQWDGNGKEYKLP